MSDWQQLENVLKGIAALGVVAALALAWMAFAAHPTALNLRRAVLTSAADLLA